MRESWTDQGPEAQGRRLAPESLCALYALVEAFKRRGATIDSGGSLDVADGSEPGESVERGAGADTTRRDGDGAGEHGAVGTGARP